MSPQKERDLELAARIGQSLLKQNQELTERNEMLDEQLEVAKEEVITDLCVHTITLKCEKLSVPLTSFRICSLLDRSAPSRAIDAR